MLTTFSVLSGGGDKELSLKAIEEIQARLEIAKKTLVEDDYKTRIDLAGSKAKYIS